MKIALLLITLVALPAHAQDSFLGVPLNRPFPGDMKECPLTALHLVDYEAIKGSGQCYFTEKPNEYAIHNSPDLGIGHTLKVTTYDGKPIIFKLSFGKARFAQAVNIFTSKYGKAQQVRNDELFTRAGERFDSHVYAWKGPKLYIELKEIGPDVRWSEGTIANIAVTDELNQKRNVDAKSAAEKL